MCVKNLSKFKDLAHKDYLGAIMSLGIKRENILGKNGDGIIISIAPSSIAIVIAAAAAIINSAKKP
jgi:RNA-binding protein YlmH